MDRLGEAFANLTTIGDRSDWSATRSRRPAGRSGPLHEQASEFDHDPLDDIGARGGVLAEATEQALCPLASAAWRRVVGGTDTSNGDVPAA